MCVCVCVCVFWIHTILTRPAQILNLERLSRFGHNNIAL